MNERYRNLLVAGKAMAQTFLANSAARLRPIEWASGVAAGVAAVDVLAEREPPDDGGHGEADEHAQRRDALRLSRPARSARLAGSSGSRVSLPNVPYLRHML